MKDDAVLKSNYLLSGRYAPGLYRDTQETRKIRIPLTEQETDAFFSVNCRNLFRILNTEQGSALFSACQEDRYPVTKEQSDFENFRSMCALLPRLAGNPYYSFFRLVLQGFFGIEEEPSSFRADAIWKAATEEKRNEFKCAVTERFSVFPVIDLTDWFFPTEEVLHKYASFSGYEEAFLSYVGQQNPSFETGAGIRVSLSFPTAFRAPDLYHVEEGYRRMSRGNGRLEDRTLLASQMMRETGIFCRQNRIPLIFLCESEIPELEPAVAYLKKSGALPTLILSGSVPHGFSPDYHSCVGNLTHHSVSGLKELLWQYASRHPIGELCISYRGNAIESGVAAERFHRVLCSFFSTLLENGDLTDYSDAVSLIRRILIGNPARLFGGLSDQVLSELSSETVKFRNHSSRFSGNSKTGSVSKSASDGAGFAETVSALED